MHDAVMGSTLEAVFRTSVLLVVMFAAHEVVTRNRLVNILIGVGLGTVFGYFGLPEVLRIDRPLWAFFSSLGFASFVYFPLAWGLKRWGPWPLNPKADKPEPREGYPPHFPKALRDRLDAEKRRAEGQGGEGDGGKQS